MSQPFLTNELGRIRPIAIELDRAGLGKYKRLATNQIYWMNALQYCGGEFYRKALGYEVLWDRLVERRMMLCLDFYMTKQREAGLYYGEEIKVIKKTRIHGVLWRRGIAPQTPSFGLQWAFDLEVGESLTARINLLDKPYHVDIERGNGEVFTIQFARYKNYLIDIFRRKPRYERRTNHTTGSSNSTKRGAKATATSLNLVRGLIKKDTARRLSKKMLSMRTG